MADSNFIDYVKIFCASGHGGAGSVHLHRAKYVPKGGPDGGDGGRGGHIILRANPQFWTLIHLKYKKIIKAEDGERGGAALCKGKQGKDIYIDVPVGTVIKDAESGEEIFEMMEAGEEKILCTVNTAQSALDLVSAGVGVCVMPDVCMQSREDVTYVPLKNWHQALYMCILYDKWLDQPVWDFVEIVVKAFRKRN